jgi:nitroimidazol reductase NimA-like FMN-containing flavoprotein (pyridoxamine 5'-phosphate oxidase superfamily)
MDNLTEFGRLRTSNITTQLPRDEMEGTIGRFLKSCNICVLATSGNDVPRATPIEYYAKGTTIYIAGAPTTKVDNIKANPRVSVGIYNMARVDWKDWADVKGAQITGTAELIREDNPEPYAEAMSIYQWQHYRKAMGMNLDKPPSTTIIKITAEKVEYEGLHKE